MMPSEMQVAMNLAADSSTTSLMAAKSPKEDMGSALRARRYASAAPLMLGSETS